MSTEQTQVAVLAAYSSEDDEIIGAALEMLDDLDRPALVDLVASMTGLALGLSNAHADTLDLPRSLILREFLTGLGAKYAAAPT